MVNSSEDPSNLQQNKDTFRQQKLRKKNFNSRPALQETPNKQASKQIHK